MAVAEAGGEGVAEAGGEGAAVAEGERAAEAKSHAAGWRAVERSARRVPAGGLSSSGVASGGNMQADRQSMQANRQASTSQLQSSRQAGASERQVVGRRSRSNCNRRARVPLKICKAVANKIGRQRARTGKARGRSDRKTGRIMARTPVASDRTMPMII